MVGITAYQEVVRPVLFESEFEEFPYWGLGSSVLVWNANAYYWVTAKHVISNQGQSFEALRIFPTDSSRMSIPFNALCEIKSPESDDEFADLYILQVDMEQFAAFGDAPITAHDLTFGVYSPDKLSVGDKLVIVGYPAESRAVDYDEFKIKFQRKVFEASYAGTGSQTHCHRLKMKDNPEISTYNGISGAPVFHIVTLGTVSFPMMVGIMLRGTDSSQIGHFVGSHVIAHATQIASDSAG
jgi:hypothetical protein